MVANSIQTKCTQNGVASLTLLSNAFDLGNLTKRDEKSKFLVVKLLYEAQDQSEETATNLFSQCSDDSKVSHAL